MKHWQILERTELIRNQWLHITSDRIKTERDVILDTFFLSHGKDWVLAIALTTQGKWVIVNQYRHGAQKICQEFPAGTMDDGEDPLQCAQRELLEETGYGGGRWVFLDRFFVNPASASNSFHIYLAKNVEFLQAPELDESEDIDVELLSDLELRRRIQLNLFDNPHHQCAFLRYCLNEQKQII